MLNCLVLQRASWLCALALASTALTYGQEVSAGITGQVADPSGAAIPMAGVIARDMNRGTSWDTVTNAEGVYAFPRIPAGTYEVRIEAKGFRTTIRRNIVLELNARLRLDVTLELGTVAETVEVSGGAIMLQTENTQVGTVMSATTNVNLPLNGRNFVQLTLLSPGATTVNPAGFTNGMRTRAGGRPYVNGNREEANNFLLDGIDNNNANSNMVTYQPNVDAIQEFKMITNNASAEFGNYQGGIINITIKSGTNQVHGTLFEFLRNDRLNAKSWSQNWAGNPKAAIRHNVYGGTIGGPIMRDKLFYFADYQGVRRANPGAPANFTVIPAEFRSGDLSRLLAERATQLYDPLTTTAAGDRQPFAGNRIPAARISGPAAKLFQMPEFYPLPLNNALRFNTLNRGANYVTNDQGDIKIDAKPSNRDDFSARYSISSLENPGTNTIPAALGTYFTSPFQAGVLNWTRTISPSLVNELRAGVNRSIFGDGGSAGDVGNVGEKLGIPGANDRGPGLIALNFVGGLANNIGNQNVGGLRHNVNNTFHYADNLTFIRGRHMVKTGGQWIRQQANVFYAGNNGRIGFMRFTGQYTSGPNANRAVSRGFPEADFILGYPTSLGRGIAAGMWGQRKYVLGAYIQDDWRVTNELTLNLGVRWEYHSPYVEVADRQANFEFYTGRFLQAGKDGVPRRLYEKYMRAWQPRVGFAWTPAFLGRKTVIRAAYTISSYLEGMGVGERLTLNPPYATEYAAIYDGFPNVVSTTSDGFTGLKPTDLFRGASIKMWDPLFRPSDAQQWSFILERQLPRDTIVSAGYVGQHGTHLCGRPYYGQKVLLPDGKVAPSPYIAGNPDLLLAANVRGTSADYSQRYDGLQATIRKRFGQGLEYQVSYTWSKGMSDSIGFYGEGGQAAAQNAHPQNTYDRKSEWGPTYFDATQMFTSHASYDLPLGRGMAFGGTWHPVWQAIAGAWRLSGMVTLRTGFPLTITALDRSGTVSGGPRADRIADGAGRRDVGPGTSWIDKAAFRQPVTGTFGSSGVGVVRGPGLRNLDVSLQKGIRVTESKRFEFRAEFFNLTNTPAFNAPDRAVNSATFGEITGAQGERNIQLALKFYF